MRRVGTLAALALVAVASLALASGASAEKLRLKGEIVGQPQSKAQITVLRNKHKNLKGILKVKFTKVNATCDDGSSGTIDKPRPASTMLTTVSVLVVSSATRGTSPRSLNASRTCWRPVDPRS